MLQVCTIHHIAARRMSPSAMFLHTPAAAHDARRNAYETPPTEARVPAGPLSSPRSPSEQPRKIIPGCWGEFGRPGGLSAPAGRTLKTAR